MFVVVVVVLVVLGGSAVLLLVRSRRKTVDDTTVSSADRIHDSYVGMSEAPTPTTAAPESDGEAALGEDPDGDAPDLDEEVDEKDEVAAARFRLPGERATTNAFGPPVLVPLMTVRHLETPVAATPDTETPDAETPDAETPDAETPDAETPDAETPDAETPDAETPDAETPKERATAVDDVVSALVERVRTSDDDVMSVVSEMVEQDLDTEQMEEVLTELVERDRSARSKSEELTLSGPDVPQRPGRLSAFADMPESQKRRVIIRVLCLLIARSEEQEPISEVDERPEYTVTLPDESVEMESEPTARDLWGEPETDARDVHLPARRHRLARVRR